MQQFNFEYLIKRTEETGQEIEKISYSHRNKEIIHVRKVNPLDRLKDEHSITKEQYWAGRKYQNDYILANISHHARTSYENKRDDKKFVKNEYNNSHLEAIINISLIKKLLGLRELRLVEWFLEREISITNILLLLGVKSKKKIYSEEVKEDIGKILLIMSNFYNF